MPKNTAKKLQSQSHFALPPIFPIKKNLSLVAAPLVIFSVAPLVKTIFLDSPVTAQ
jgi:hypothetical protein